MQEVVTVKPGCWVILFDSILYFQHCRAAGDRKSASSIDLLADKVSEEEITREEDEDDEAVEENTMSQINKSSTPDESVSVRSYGSKKSEKDPNIKEINAYIKGVKSEQDKNQPNEDFQKMLHESVAEIERAVTVRLLIK